MVGRRWGWILFHLGIILVVFSIFSLAGCTQEHQSVPVPAKPSPSIEGTYVGSIDSNVYHYPYCVYAQQISPENKIWFTSVTEAEAKGYRPCNLCKPPSSTLQPNFPPVPRYNPCPGATAICQDGTCSYSQHRSGTCSYHGGVKQWINRPPN
jgi:hypothetical protein